MSLLQPRFAYRPAQDVLKPHVDAVVVRRRPVMDDSHGNPQAKPELQGVAHSRRCVRGNPVRKGCVRQQVLLVIGDSQLNDDPGLKGLLMRGGADFWCRGEHKRSQVQRVVAPGNDEAQATPKHTPQVGAFVDTRRAISAIERMHLPPVMGATKQHQFTPTGAPA